MKKSMIEIAYNFLSDNKGVVPFIQLWNQVAEEMGFTETQKEDNIAQFYTDLSMDGRFLNMAGNTWDLRSRHTFSEGVIDTDSIAIDEDEMTEQSQEDSEEKE